MPDEPTIPDATCPPFSSASNRDLLAGILLASGGDPASIPNTTQCREWGYGRYTERDILAAILLATGTGGGGGVWGSITGTLSDQTDLQTALNGKLGVSAQAADVNPLGTAIAAALAAKQNLDPAASARYAVHPAQWGIYWDANTTATVSGTGVTGPVGRVLTLLTGTTLNSRSQRSGEGGGNSDVFLNSPGFTQSGIDFSKQVTVSFALALISSSGATSDVYFRLGQSAGTTGTLGTAGIGIRISNLTMTGLAHNGTTLTTSSTLKTLTAGSLTTWVVIQSNGAGSVAFYVDGTLAATVTGGPTSVVTAPSTFAVEALNGATAAQTRLHLNQPRIRLD